MAALRGQRDFVRQKMALIVRDTVIHMKSDYTRYCNETSRVTAWLIRSPLMSRFNLSYRKIIRHRLKEEKMRQRNALEYHNDIFINRNEMNFDVTAGNLEIDHPGEAGDMNADGAADHRAAVQVYDTTATLDDSTMDMLFQGHGDATDAIVEQADVDSGV